MRTHTETQSSRKLKVGQQKLQFQCAFCVLLINCVQNTAGFRSGNFSDFTCVHANLQKITKFPQFQGGAAEIAVLGHFCALLTGCVQKLQDLGAGTF
jgi:hypothetical protein